VRAEEKSAEAVVAEKAGNAAGAKGRRTKNGANEVTGDGGKEGTRIAGVTTTVTNSGVLVGRSGATAVSRERRDQAGLRGTSERERCTRV
jgi:hypothetical protein